jgi:ribonuclease HI
MRYFYTLALLVVAAAPPAPLGHRRGRLRHMVERSGSRRRRRRKGGTLRDGERRQLALASRHGAAPSPTGGRCDRVLCDGGSRGNPGPAAIAAVLVTAGGDIAARRAELIGRATAAAAEYRAILLGLELAASRGIATLDVCSDSKLAIAGVAGVGPGDPELAELAREIATAAQGFARVGWIWHPRAENGAADALVRELLWG